MLSGISIITKQYDTHTKASYSFSIFSFNLVKVDIISLVEWKSTEDSTAISYTDRASKHLPTTQCRELYLIGIQSFDDGKRFRVPRDPQGLSEITNFLVIDSPHTFEEIPRRRPTTDKPLPSHRNQLSTMENDKGELVDL